MSLYGKLISHRVASLSLDTPLGDLCFTPCLIFLMIRNCERFKDLIFLPEFPCRANYGITKVKKHTLSQIWLFFFKVIVSLK